MVPRVRRGKYAKLAPAFCKREDTRGDISGDLLRQVERSGGPRPTATPHMAFRKLVKDAKKSQSKIRRRSRWRATAAAQGQRERATASDRLGGACGRDPR